MKFHWIISVCFLVVYSCSGNGKSANTASERHDTTKPAMMDTGRRPSPPPPSYMQETIAIIPGKQIGLIQLEQDADSVVARLGKPDRSDAAMGKAWLVWTANHETHSAHETAIYTARNMGVGREVSRVREIRITSDFFHTADSLHTGLRLEEIIAKMPQLIEVADQSPTSSAKRFYDDVKGGISFEFDQSGVCVAIIVHQKNRKLTDIYLPLQS